MVTDLDVRIATLPAFPDQPNEDYASAAGNVVVLLDGAGIRKVPTGCRHSVHWYVQQLGPAILRYAQPTTIGLDEVLRQAIIDVRGLHGGTCDLDHPNSPSATVIMTRVTEQIESLVLADSTLVVRHRDDELSVVSDDRLEALVDRLKGEGVAPTPGWLADYRNKPGGFWVAGANPDVVSQAVRASWPRDEVASLALLTDGAARVVDLFHDQTWPEVIETIIDEGPQIVLDRTRELEATDPDRSRWPRAKTNDDATIAHIDLNGW